MADPIYIHSWAPDDVLTDLGAHFDIDHVDVFAPGVFAKANAAFPERVAGKVGAVVNGAVVDAKVLESNAGTLKVVANCAVGVDNIDVEAATANGILVTNTPGVLTDAVADFSIGAVIAIGRRMAEGDRFTRAGKFDSYPFPLLWGSDISGETLGIIGMGRIGQAVARRARGFNFDLVYHNRTRLAPDLEKELNATWLTMDDLLRVARFVIVLTPLTPDTRHLINAERLALMRPDGYLINVSRGPVVHEAALLEVLENGRIAGAALDVYEFEPKVTEGLISLENVMLTPHIASASAPTRHAMVRLAAANLKAALLGEAVPCPVNTPLERD